MGKRETQVPGNGTAPIRRVALGSAVLLPAAVLQIIAPTRREPPRAVDVVGTR